MSGVARAAPLRPRSDAIVALYNLVQQHISSRLTSQHRPLRHRLQGPRRAVRVRYVLRLLFQAFSLTLLSGFHSTAERRAAGLQPAQRYVASPPFGVCAHERDDERLRRGHKAEPRCVVPVHHQGCAAVAPIPSLSCSSPSIAVLQPSVRTRPVPVLLCSAVSVTRQRSQRG